ncbi:MAG: VOC family protein [Steroidobacteraceae bacterium]
MDLLNMRPNASRRNQMNKAVRIVLTAGVGLLLAATAQAGVTLNAARVGGANVAALAKFYASAYGMQEVNRLSLPGGNLEIMLNFGDSVDAAKADRAAQIVIMHRAGALKDPVPHLILNVTDMAATVAAIKTAGGSMAGAPRAFGNTGIMIGIAMDPAGNRIEMIQQPAH